MIIVNITGGLGNQMFQYAAARRLSFVHNTSLLLDIRGYHKQKERKFTLDKFKVKLNYATVKDIASLVNIPLLDLLYFIPSKYQKLYTRLLKIKYKSLIFEKHFHFDKDILSAPNNIYLLGYFQSEEYFFDIKDIIRKEFVCRSIPSSQNRTVLEKIRKTTSVSIHLRRNDRVSQEGKKRIHGTPAFSYYQKAISYLTKRVTTPLFFIFSDDPIWAKNNFKINHKTVCVDINTPDRDYEDLRLMAACRHNIIANSTFSWWAAWLNRNKKKIVIAPKRWFRLKHLNTKDLIPKDWIRL